MDRSIDDQEILNKFRKRRQAFNELCNKLWDRFGEPYEVFNRCTCPACGHPTLSQGGNYDMCRLCDWEDDGQDDENADETWHGPNVDYSLTEARLNFARFGSMYRPEDTHSTERAGEYRQENETLRRMYENLLGILDQRELASQVLAVKRFEGSATTLEEFLAFQSIRYEQRKGVILDTWWLPHPVWKGTPYRHGPETPESALRFFHHRFDNMQDLCNRLQSELPGGTNRRPCPACGLPTLKRRRSKACPLCGWNRTVSTKSDPNQIKGGPRKNYSLTEARLNFDKYLTMYRPGDEPHFSLSEKNPLKKCLLIRAYLKLCNEGIGLYDRLQEIGNLENQTLSEWKPAAEGTIGRQPLKST